MVIAQKQRAGQDSVTSFWAKLITGYNVLSYLRLSLLPYVVGDSIAGNYSLSPSNL